ncbi:MAG: hypothetical protein AAFU79_13900 [Myxococcota bacterium]
MSKLTKRTFQLGLRLSAALARSPFHGLTEAAMAALARLTVGLRKGRHQETLGAVAREWQRMFPSRRMVPIVEETEDTVIAEIHARCPLRGTGDAHACYRMMAYDRKMLGALGGQLVVLESQSVTGEGPCRVALRAAGAPLDDLVPAHQPASRAPTKQPRAQV